jgi:CMP-N-acetylneuraminic acid synthetase
LQPFLSAAFTGHKDAHNMPRQSFPEAFSHVDVIALRWKTLVEERTMAGEHIRFHKIKKEDALDIDSEIDFSLAELLLKKRMKML